MRIVSEGQGAIQGNKGLPQTSRGGQVGDLHFNSSLENHSEPILDAEIIKDTPDLVTVASGTQSCQLEVNQENDKVLPDKVLEEPNTKEPSTQTSTEKPLNTLVEILCGVKMQVILSDNGTVAADQLTPVLIKDQKSEEPIEKVSEISGTLAASVLFHVSPEHIPDPPEQPQTSCIKLRFIKDHKRDRPPRKPPDTLSSWKDRLFLNMTRIECTGRRFCCSITL